MYPTTKSEEYYPQATAPSVTTGFPVGSAGQFYSQMGPSAAFGVRAQTTVPWSTGLCDCSDDCGNCCITCCCPCITFGQVAEIVDRGSTSCGTSGALYSLLAMVTGLPCLYSCFYRSKMRGDYSLQQSSYPDCLVHFCCECCALCQMYRELKNRGFDMDIGWHANMEKRGAMAPPGVPGGMNRY